MTKLRVVVAKPEPGEGLTQSGEIKIHGYRPTRAETEEALRLADEANIVPVEWLEGAETVPSGPARVNRQPAENTPSPGHT